ncbi:MAG TPA: phage tail protein, partial [Chromatiales bacterium]|nr:phage tail protein [Chromatiales bacterium]
RGASAWHYTSASREVVANVDGNGDRTYRPAAISRGSLGLGPEAGRRSIDLRCPRDLDLAREYRGAPQPQPMGVSIYRRFGGDWDWALVWTGRVLQVVFGEREARIRCEPASISLKRLGLRRLYSRLCPHVLYGAECRAMPVAEPFTVSQVDGRSVRFEGAGFPPDRFAGGYLERADGTRHMIEGNDDMGGLTLIYPAPLLPGETVSLHAGCDHTLQTCQSRFGNADNFGGFPWIPRKNPFNESAY